MLKKDYILNIVPKYAVLPLIASFVANLIAYYGSTAVVYILGITRHSVSLPIDSLIPFDGRWIIVYFGCYVTWIFYYVYACRDSKETCYKFITAEVIAKLLCFVFFVCYPTIMTHRGDVFEMDEGFFRYAMDFLYNKSDKPYNLFPSIHCLASWICFRGTLMCKKPNLGIKISALIIAMLVFLSVLFTKQHYFIDIIGGIAVVEIGIFISVNLKLSDKILRKVSKSV
ncbi:MAG: phosphatase PAP2 family protein [Clostridia bacterium]|nr:phosphatase PAP2 family protein [Clostridia bacterium]